MPGKISIDKRGANTAAVQSVQANSGAGIERRPSRHLNNVIEQDHRAIKRIARPMPGFKSFHCAHVLIAGTLTMHMIRTGQLDRCEAQASCAASQFYWLAF